MPATKKAAKKAAAKTANRQRREGSIPDQLNALQVGQSIGFTRRLALSEIAAGFEDVTDTLKQLRNTAHTSVARITDELDARTFAVESTAALNDGKDAVICCVNVCRTE